MRKEHHSKGVPPANKKQYLKGDIIGNNLIFIEEMASTKAYARAAKLTCHCGKEFTISNLLRVTSGKTKSCGCLVHRPSYNRTHNMSSSTEFKAWAHMKGRCLNPNAEDYKHYGGRGIKICERWANSFQNFLLDMGYKPTQKHSIDRIDVNGNYEPNNCKWSTQLEQVRNRRNTRFITYNGMSMTALEWAEKTGINVSTIKERIRRGYSPEIALTAKSLNFGTKV